MRLLSVNIGTPQELDYQGRKITTAIFKSPVTGEIEVGRRNLAGDRQADLRAHGGTDKAVYVYPYEHYAYWQSALNRDPFPYGQFGENFTTEGLLEENAYIGDIYRIGEALFQISQPRTPCYKLDIRMNLEKFRVRFSASLRVGYYLRVLKEGRVAQDLSFELIERPTIPLTVRETFVARHGALEDPSLLERARQNPALAENWRKSLEKRLQTIK
jgi:MOSC domain-containing protein YiiM